MKATAEKTFSIEFTEDEFARLDEALCTIIDAIKFAGTDAEVRRILGKLDQTHTSLLQALSGEVSWLL